MLSKRLSSIAEMVDTKVLYDVGCDHALLDIYLSNEKNIKCIAIDKSIDCVNKAIKNVKKNSSNIKVLLNDGLNNIDILENSTVVISGMGTKNIIKIIENKKIDYLICQSNKNIYELRKNVCNLGYHIIDEKIVLEDKYYIIIKFEKGYKKYNEKEYYLGPILLKNKNNTYIDYLYKLKQNIEKNINKYEESKKKKINTLLNQIKEEIEYN